MTLPAIGDSSLISVIITCYNHAEFLATAIRSAVEQDYETVEIIVVDDGSIDKTREIAEQFENVKYVYQSNQGLSAARNTGVRHSNGDFLVFLDADDWLLPGALSTNSKYLQRNPDAAFVSGGYLRINKRKESENPTKSVTENHFCRLLEENYIQMHAAVLYRRRVFDEFQYDTTLKACEDYDLYLRIAEKYPIFHHTKLIAAYYLHGQNMSADLPMMLETALQVLERRRPLLKNADEKKSLQKGRDFFKQAYCTGICAKLSEENRSVNQSSEKKEIETLRKHRKTLYLKYLLGKRMPTAEIKLFLGKKAPRFVLKGLHKFGIVENFSPPPNRIKLGDFRRATPFADDFGYSRGGPVDRYYIENFLRAQSAQIKGRVLEIGDNDYTLRFGGANVTRSDVLHVSENYPNATFYGDLSDAPQLPPDAFDCIVLTQTLQMIYDSRAALETCYRILKPGGTLLLTVPGISQIDGGEWKDAWLWSFTANAINRMLSEIFPFENVSVKTDGNVLVAAAFLYGVGLPEIEKEQMDVHDARYQLIISASAVKPL